MGIDSDRFVSSIGDELQCSICCSILEKPIQIRECQHTFCKDCFDQWFENQQTCPIDRNFINQSDIIPVSRLLNTLLNRLEIKCEFESSGCTSVVALEFLSSHVAECEFNPENMRHLWDIEYGEQSSEEEELEHNYLLEEMIENNRALNLSLIQKDEIISKLEEEISSLKIELGKFQVLNNPRTSNVPSSHPIKSIIENHVSLRVYQNSHKSCFKDFFILFNINFNLKFRYQNLSV
jgi:E3 ubiquitin-protein ligase NRDP1